MCVYKEINILKIFLNFYCVDQQQAFFIPIASDSKTFYRTVAKRTT